VTIPFVDLSVKKDSVLHKRYIAAFSDIMESGQFILGPYLDRMEKRLAEYCGCKYALGLNSGTDALLLTLKTLDIGAGDEVIVPANVFHAVGNVVLLAGAKPVFCDVRYDDMLMDAGLLESLISEKTKAIIPVHLTGMPCDMDAILDVAGSYGLHVIEDAAQALGAEYKGKKAGTMGKAGCFSFHPLKNIHAMGDGGAVVTNDPVLYKRLLRLRNHGLESGCVLEAGYNSRLDEIHAAAIDIQLEYIDSIIEEKNRYARIYDHRLKDVVSVCDNPDYKKGVYQLYMIKSRDRDGLKTFLSGQGIETAVHYSTYYPYQAWGNNLGVIPQLPVTQRLSNEVLSLPVFPGLGEDRVNRVVESIISLIMKKGSIRV
jgi:dTDP-4-amino-4,6-dideoxygalactose transaminase